VGDRVRILTANLWNGGADPQAFAELVAAQEVDVACLQELAPEQAEALARVLPHGVLEPARDHRGMGIALRRPATQRRIALPHRDAFVAELRPGDWPGLAHALEVINVHVMGPHVRPLVYGWRVRRGQLAGIASYLDTAVRQPRLLVGDLNATPLWRVYRRLASRLSDLAEEAARRRAARPPATWGPTPAWPRLLRIDHALGEGLRVEDARVVPLPWSDHSALIVDVTPAPPGETERG
jgi:endonuclease/exonuclease/phosphatase (EEP) superfamily protein YafD